MPITRELALSTRAVRGNDQSYRAQVIADAPRCYWRFTESAPTDATATADEMGLLNGVYRDPRGGELAKVPGPRGGPALRVASTTAIASSPACVAVADNQVTRLQSTAVWSLEFWARRGSSARSPAFPGLFSKNSSTGWVLYVPAATTMALSFKRAALDIVLLPGGAGPSKQANLSHEWRHFVISWTGTQFRAYVNGQFRGSSTQTLVDSADTTVLRMGLGDQQTFPVELAEVAIYDTLVPHTLPQAHFDAMMGGITV